MARFLCIVIAFHVFVCSLLATPAHDDYMPGQAMPIPMRVEETFTVYGFDKVIIDVPCDLILAQADRETLTIDGQKELINRVDVRVNGDTLFITKKETQTTTYKSADIFRPLVLELGFIHLSSLQMNEGTVQCDGLRSKSLSLSFGSSTSGFMSIFVENLMVNLRGSGRLQLRGIVATQRVSASGIAKYNATDVQSENAQMYLSGKSRSWITVKSRLTGNVSDSAELYYTGLPHTFKVNVTGRGVVEAASSGGAGVPPRAPGDLLPKSGSAPPTGGLAPPGNTPYEQRPPASSLNQYFDS